MEYVHGTGFWALPVLNKFPTFDMTYRPTESDIEPHCIERVVLPDFWKFQVLRLGIAKCFDFWKLDLIRIRG